MDTHILIRWLSEAKKLSRTQHRVLESAIRRGEPVAFSAMCLMEIAVLTGGGRTLLRTSIEEFFEDLSANPAFQVLPLTYEIAREVALLAALRDPADRAIVATARVHRLRLVTSDQRIVASKMVAVIE
ncbi:MAG TPA: type II toxin-antitoxin system VapC family toxin [Bryobacteraceae bacterium]